MHSSVTVDDPRLLFYLQQVFEGQISSMDEARSRAKFLKFDRSHDGGQANDAPEGCFGEDRRAGNREGQGADEGVPCAGQINGGGGEDRVRLEGG